MAQLSLAGNAIPALFVYVAHSRLGYAAKVTPAQLVAHLRREYSIAESTGRRFVRSFLATHVLDGKSARFAELAEDGTIVRLGVDRFLCQVGVSRRMLAPLNPEDVRNPRSLTLALYELIGFCLNRHDDGSEHGITVISRAALEKLTGLSPSSQRRLEREIGITTDPIYAYVLRPEGEDTSVQRLCSEFGQRVAMVDGMAVQIRNAFRVNRPAVRVRKEWYRIFGETAASQARFNPDTWSQRQLFAAGTLERDVVQDLIKHGGDVDIWLGYGVHEKTGEVVGICAKLLAHDAYTTRDLDAIVAHYNSGVSAL